MARFSGIGESQSSVRSIAATAVALEAILQFEVNTGAARAQRGFAGLSAKLQPLRSVLDFAGIWVSRRLNTTPPALPILIIMITDKCQLRCTMCGACDYSPGDHGMLSLAEWKAVIDSAAKIRTRIVSITGGEALLRRDLFELIRYIRGYNMAVHLNTNGLLLNDANVARISDTGVATISVSVESTDPDTHDMIRGKGMFDRTVKGIRKLREGAPEVRIGLNCVMNKHNLSTLPAMVPWAAQEGLDQLKFAPIHTNLQHKDKPVGEYANMIFDEGDEADLEACVDALQDHLAGQAIQSTSKAFFDGVSNLYRKPASNFYCYAGYAITTIDAQGNVAACFDKAPAQNVRDMPLDEIWRSKQFHEHRQLVRNCATACWDTTNCELSLRMNAWQMLKSPLETIRAIRYYLGDDEPKPAARPASDAPAASEACK